MLWPLSWVDDNWRRMFRTWVIYYYALTVVMWLWQLTEHFYIWGIYYHALTVVLRWWQLTEHDWYYRGILPCYERCHKTMTTGQACFNPLGCITMLWPLSWDDNNWRSMFHTILEIYFTMLWTLSWDDGYWQTMFHTSGIYNHVLTLVMRRWQLTERVSYLRDE